MMLMHGARVCHYFQDEAIDTRKCDRLLLAKHWLRQLRNLIAILTTYTLKRQQGLFVC